MSTTTGRGGTPRFLQLSDVAEVLNISVNQVYALVRRGELPAIKIGGRGQWRVETVELEKVFARAWDGYIRYRKSPRKRAAGEGYFDPSFQLPVEWLDTRAKIDAAAEDAAREASIHRTAASAACARSAAAILSAASSKM